LSESYTPESLPEKTVHGGFTVLPDYTVIIPKGPERIKHDITLGRFLTKVSQTDEAVIYKLDFQSVVRLLDSLQTVDFLREYLKSSDRPLPENIVQALNDWEKQSKRVRIKRAVILECDDEALLEELTHYKGMDKHLKEKVGFAVVIQGDSAGEVKKLIEKNKRFCIDAF
jgi:hypothetical protein